MQEVNGKTVHHVIHAADAYAPFDLYEEHAGLHYLADNLQNIDWKQYLLVTGNPGCGKTHVMNACVSECLKNDLQVLVVAQPDS